MTVVPSWKTEFPWLVTDDTGTANPPKVYWTCRSVYSVLARKQVADKYRKYANGSYVTGSGYLRHDGLDHHQNSEGHRYAAQYLAVNAQKPGSSIAEKAIQSMNRATFDTAQAVGEVVEQEAACDVDYDSDFSDMECGQSDNDME